jgi:hypothetical protein
MKDIYHIDLEKFSLGEFKRSLKSREMIPSRVSLKIELDDRFQVLSDHGISNMKELSGTLKTKLKIETFSNRSGLAIEYLTLLRREANSYLPNPIRLDTFPGISPKYVERLKSVGLANSRQMFNKASDKKERGRLSIQTEIPIEILDELVCLSDLSRAYGVGPVFARLIFDVGIRSIKEFIALEAEDFIRIYESKTQKKADFGVNEIQFSLDLARELAVAVEV